MSPTKCNSLFLYPKTTDWNPDINYLISALSNIGLINEKIPNTQHSFFIGDQFLHYINFLGCSPSIQFSATENKANFCFVRLINHTEITMIQSSKQQRAPHCPHCKKSVSQWRELTSDQRCLCPHCQQLSNLFQYNWKRTAGFARIFIEITDIYPKEAIPQAIFLEKLSTSTDQEWDYFYCCA